MKDFKEIDAKELKENVFDVIGKQWLLVTAGKKDKFNTMTASWGTMGVLFNKPVAIIFIRPQRYTFEFIEKEPEFTLTVLPEQYRAALNLCGKKSGRDCDKVKEAGLTAIETENGNMAFAEGRLVFECKKLYGKFLDPKEFLDESIDSTWFAAKDYHKVFIAEIEKVYEKTL